MSDIRSQVYAVVQKVARQRGLDPSWFSGAGNLVDGGLKSLDLSRIVALLELALEVDPFLTRPITDIRTVDDLCSAYEAAKTSDGNEDAATPDPPQSAAAGALAERRKAARRQGGAG